MTELLQLVSQGDKEAEADLLARVYDELHRMALNHMRGERPDHTLRATALVHEAYLRLIAEKEIDWKSRTHFFSLAAQTMRRILVDYARRRRSGKRNGVHVSLDEGLTISPDECDLVADLDEALMRLGEMSPRASRVVELKFFGGLNEEEIAELLKVSARTVKRDWKIARAWLFEQLL